MTLEKQVELEETLIHSVRHSRTFSFNKIYKKPVIYMGTGNTQFLPGGSNSLLRKMGK